MRSWKNRTRRGISLALTLVLCLSVLPAPVQAAEEPACPCGQEDCLCPGGECGCEAGCACELCGGTSPEETGAAPAEPEEPEDPAGPEEPIEPADPVNPEDPADPEDPASPEDPADPEGPAGPEDPEASGEPEEPADTGAPGETGEEDSGEDAGERSPVKEEAAGQRTVRLVFSDPEQDGMRMDLYLDETLIQADADDFCVRGETVFFSGARGICRYDPAQDSTEVLCGGARLSCLTVFEGLLLGLEDALTRLCAVETDGGRLIRTNYTSVDRFWIADGRLHVDLLADPDLAAALEETEFAVTAAQAVTGAEAVTDPDGGLKNLLRMRADGSASLLGGDLGEAESLPLDALLSVSPRANAQNAVLFGTDRNEKKDRVYCHQLNGAFLSDKVVKPATTHVKNSTNYAFDLCMYPNKEGDYPGFIRAPFDGKITYIETPQKEKTNNHTIHFTSSSPVRLANGETAYLTIITMHADYLRIPRSNDSRKTYWDTVRNKNTVNNRDLLTVGMTFTKGQVYTTEGDFGQSSGVHVHLECHKHSSGISQDQAYKEGAREGTRGNIRPDEALFIASDVAVQTRTAGESNYKNNWSVAENPPLWIRDPGDGKSVPKGNITISPSNYPQGSMKQGTDLNLKGSIRSTYPIYTYSATIRRTNGQYVKSVGGNGEKRTSRSLSSPNLSFKSLKPGTYILRVRASDCTGTRKDWEQTFTVAAAVNQPVISEKNIAGGKQVTISCSTSGAAVYYTINGGSQKSAKVERLMSPGSYTIKAWSVKGSDKSPTVSRTVKVQQAAAPQISGLIVQGSRAYVTISGTGTIYYTTGGGMPNAKYTGPIDITGNCTIRANAVENGKADSGVSQRTITCGPPEMVTSITVPYGGGRIAAGKSAAVRWTAVPGAASYEARLYRDGVRADSKTVSSPNAAFTLREAGTYTVRVVAKNSFGESGESSAYAVVEAMAPVTVTVVDQITRTSTMTDAAVAALQQRIRDYKNDLLFKLEGNVISVQTIDYGASPQIPNAPTKEGFNFSGYSISPWNTAVTENTTVYAGFSPQSYSVEFWDFRLGSNARKIKGQTVSYGSSAVPPEVTPPNGYVLAGWSVDPAKSSCADYSFVEGPMKLYTSYTWANQNLPAAVKIDSVTRNERYTSYTWVSVRLLFVSVRTAL